MTKKSIIIIICLISVHLVSLQVNSQTRTVGLFMNDTAQASKGYTLLSPMQSTMTYLINNEGRVVHKWSNSKYTPGRSLYLLSNGHLLRTGSVRNDSVFTGGGDGGRIEEYTWGDTLVWNFNYCSSTYTAHHDIRRLPNGNILVLACEKKSLSEMLTAGFDTSRFQPDLRTRKYIMPEYLVEVQPTYPSGGNIVWQWHVWDHIIQDFNPTKQNYGVVRNHPELVCTLGSLDSVGGGGSQPIFWNHANAIDYNSKFDQIMISCRNSSEIWVIDHSTTTAEAAGHTGGKYGKGGDLLYRWGNPKCYRMGTLSNQKLFQQHNVSWIDSTNTGAGDILCFNNGEGRKYTTADQFTPPVDSRGFYTREAGKAFGPSAQTWTYSATPATSFYCTDLGGASRLANGNTLLCNGIAGQLFEVTASGQTVWKYVNPVVPKGPLNWNDVIPNDPNATGQLWNEVFRAQRYSPSYPGLVGRNLTPGSIIEINVTGIEETEDHSANLFHVYPNPFQTATTISFDLPVDGPAKLLVYDMFGREMTVLLNEFKTAGNYSVKCDATGFPNGIYLCKLTIGGYSTSKKLMLLR